jgi:hypothetical protein
MRAVFAPVSCALLGSLALARKVSDPVVIGTSARHKSAEDYLDRKRLGAIIDGISSWRCQPQSISFRARTSRASLGERRREG